MTTSIPKGPCPKTLEPVAKELILMKFKPTDTLKECVRKFHKVMRKYGIKHGTKVGNGTSFANFEWTICWYMFMQTLTCHLQMRYNFGDSTPKDLKAY